MHTRRAGTFSTVAQRFSANKMSGTCDEDYIVLFVALWLTLYFYFIFLPYIISYELNQVQIYTDYL